MSKFTLNYRSFHVFILLAVLLVAVSLLAIPYAVATVYSVGVLHSDTVRLQYIRYTPCQIVDSSTVCQYALDYRQYVVSDGRYPMPDGLTHTRDGNTVKGDCYGK